MPQGKSKEGKLWKQKMLKLLDQPGVKEHGRVGSETIIEATKRADVFAYPTDFPEISCITAIKMQAAKCRVLTSSFAALKETIVEDEDYLNVNNPKDMEIFKDKLIELMNTPRDNNRLDKIAETVLQKYDWTNVAQQWDNVFHEGNTTNQKSEVQG